MINKIFGFVIFCLCVQFSSLVSDDVKTTIQSRPANPYSLATHNVVGFSESRDIAFLDDGSVWNISQDDLYVIEHWSLNQPIRISLTGHPVYPYWLTNQNVGSEVDEVIASLSHVIPNMNTRHIANINNVSNEILLDDGSTWKMAPNDSEIISQMSVNDVLIIGLNNGRMLSTFPNILINPSVNDFPRGACISHP